MKARGGQEGNGADHMGRGGRVCAILGPMILVSGTKRSGTSMWMQVLKAAGFPILGEAFPRDWGETIREANSEGFYESPLRAGIYYATNPHPQTGAFLAPHDTRNIVVKVFAQGLVKSDLAYLDHVLASMRSVREYAASLTRLYAMEQENKRAAAVKAGRSAESVPEYVYLPPALEWWRDNYALLRDALVRRYPWHMVTYTSVLRDPAGTVGEVLRWLGSEPSEAAVQVVRESLRTQVEAHVPAEAPEGLTREQLALCDELYACIDARRALDTSLIDRLNAAHDDLEPRIARAIAAVQRHRATARKAAAPGTTPRETPG